MIPADKRLKRIRYVFQQTDFYDYKDEGFLRDQRAFA